VPFDSAQDKPVPPGFFTDSKNQTRKGRPPQGKGCAARRRCTSKTPVWRPATTGGPASIYPKVSPEEFLCATCGAKDAGLPDPDQRRRGKRQPLGPPQIEGKPGATRSDSGLAPLVGRSDRGGEGGLRRPPLARARHRSEDRALREGPKEQL